MINIHEIIMATSDKTETAKKTNLIKNGKLRKIAPKVYTTNMDEDPIIIVKRNLFDILGQLYPNAVISHRSAFEFKPTENGDIYLTYKYSKIVSLPGIKVHLIEGPAGTEYDRPFIGNLFVASNERRILENLQKGRARNGSDSKCLHREIIENSLEKMLQVNGEAGINEFRDKARSTSILLGMTEEFETLNGIIGALLSTKPSAILTSDNAIARAAGLPYDGDRVKLFEVLFEALHNEIFPVIDEPNQTNSEFRNFAFFESYFSNYIEGTEFEIEEARAIIDTGQPMPARNADSHDVLGTFQIVSSRREMRRTPRSAEELIEILQERHRIMMAARPDRDPGMFKMKNNHAGDTHFVDYGLVRGTLTKGYEYYRTLESPFSRALFMLFMVSEVHPFNDGNGRMSRLLTLLMLYQNGYVVGQYISIEKAIAETKDEYYAALAQADQHWHEEENDPTPFIKYMLAVICSCYQDFEQRVDLVGGGQKRVTAYERVRSYAMERLGAFTKQEAAEACPGFGTSSIESALKKLTEEGVLERIGAGRKTQYVRR